MYLELARENIDSQGHSDSQILRVFNIALEEPDPELFEFPSDYEIIDYTSPMTD